MADALSLHTAARTFCIAQHALWIGKYRGTDPYFSRCNGQQAVECLLCPTLAQVTLGSFILQKA